MSAPEFSPVSVDLHFHTNASYDGRTTEEDVARFLDERTLDVIAITDHDTVENALLLKERHPLNIIPGVEVTTADGELVCLGVTGPIEKHMPAVETARTAHSQGAIVMLQHPFHKNGLSGRAAREVQAADRIDVVEDNNGRDIFKCWYGFWARFFAAEFDIPTVSNGDTHGPPGVGRSHTRLSRMPDINDMEDVVDALRHDQIGRAKRFAGIMALRQPSLARAEKARAA